MTAGHSGQVSQTVHDVVSGENWYPEDHQAGVNADIARGLHELFRNTAGVPENYIVCC
jgi:hypothetical protein